MQTRPVETHAIQLREIQPDDLERLNQWRNDAEIIDLLGNNFLYIAQAVDEAWYQSYLQNRDKQVRLAIVVTETNDYIGNVNLTAIHPINASAEFSILIGDKNYWSQGIGTQATAMMLSHGFQNLNLNRIYLTVLTKNVRAIKTYQKLGFKEEGIQRQAVFKNGQYCDLLMMSILKEAFLGM